MILIDDIDVFLLVNDYNNNNNMNESEIKFKIILRLDIDIMPNAHIANKSLQFP